MRKTKVTLGQLNKAYDILSWRMGDCYSCVHLHEIKYALVCLEDNIKSFEALVDRPFNKRAEQDRKNAEELLLSAKNEAIKVTAQIKQMEKEESQNKTQSKAANQILTTLVNSIH